MSASGLPAHAARRMMAGAINGIGLLMTITGPPAIARTATLIGALAAHRAATELHRPSFKICR